MTEREILAEVAVPYVSYTAARAYADHAGIEVERARRDLTAMLCEAIPVDELAEPERWRYRSHDTGLDISVRLVREPPLAIVTAVSIRPYTRSPSYYRRQERRRRERGGGS